ncbi:MAG: serine O-acetyltransferase [Candidatus Omnitrophica bacterium]|nr:serine O-acetyltransferase [Candidatus Omnitrophota bacterium]MDD5487647.1 serine O-acetyltransferase [Candidatus Omnitrophota bacterium]
MDCILQFMLLLVAALILFYALVRVFFSGELKAAKDRDPAARSYAEIIFTYAGLHALVLYRISHVLAGMKVPFLPRFISQFARWITGIEIHPGAAIGKGFFIDHGMGVVIGETTVIGDNVTLFQGVTLGGTGKETGKRHPTLKDNVVVGAGAKVLGNITVGNNVMIGSNAVVLRDVPDDSTVVGVPGRIARRKGKRLPGGINLDHTSLPDPLQQALERLQHEIDHIEGELGEYHHGPDNGDTEGETA